MPIIDMNGKVIKKESKDYDTINEYRPENPRSLKEKVLSLVKDYTARRSGSMKKAEKMEERALKNRRDQNIRNKAPGI